MGMRKILLLISCMMNLVSCTMENRQNSVANANDDSLFLLVGSYASPKKEGIKLYSFNQNVGEMRYVSGMKGISNPSYLTTSADGKRVFAVSEDGVETSAASVIALDVLKGKFQKLDSQLTQGEAPCYIALSPDEDFVVTANYHGGSISVFPYDRQGKLDEPRVISFVGHGKDPERQDRAHLHCIGFSPDRKIMACVDLGTDCIHVFTLNAYSNQPTIPFLNEDDQQNLELPAGCGPRHLCFSPNKKYVYLITELSGEVIAMEYKGMDTQIIQTIKSDTLDAGGSADIHITPDGRFLYTSHRLKGDGIAIFSVNETNGKLARIGYQPTGLHPRNFVISPNGKYLLVACRDSNEIQIYEINTQNGLLKNTGKIVKTSQPTCLKFVGK